MSRILLLISFLLLSSDPSARKANDEESLLLIFTCRQPYPQLSLKRSKNRMKKLYSTLGPASKSSLLLSSPLIHLLLNTLWAVSNESIILQQLLHGTFHLTLSFIPLLNTR